MYVLVCKKLAFALFNIYGVTTAVTQNACLASVCPTIIRVLTEEASLGDKKQMLHRKGTHLFNSTYLKRRPLLKRSNFISLITNTDSICYTRPLPPAPTAVRLVRPASKVANCPQAEFARDSRYSVHILRI